MSNLITYYQDTLTNSGRTPITKSNTDLATLNGYATEMSGDLNNLLSSQNAITTDVQSISEKNEALTELQAGADPVDIQSAQLAVTQAQNALQTAQENLQNCYVTAPFSGTLADVDVQVGDPASSATTVATLIDNQEVADIPLNEVDVAKIKVGDKATLTFDAISGLTLTGKVASIDSVGVVTSGVVNYNVTISFDSADQQILSGMSTTASIITQIDQNVLLVPSNAIKTTANGSYVQVLTTTPSTSSATTSDTSEETGTPPTTTDVVSATPPQQIQVTVGISDDTNTEVVSGLTEGEQIVIKTITAAQAASTAAAKSSTPSLLGSSSGGGRAGGGSIGGGALRGL